MPASDGELFVNSMDKMLCGLERDLQLSAKELEVIRGELVKDLRSIGGGGVGKLPTLRVGGQRILVPSEETARIIAGVRQGAQDRLGLFSIKWLDTNNLAGRIDSGFSKAEVGEFIRHSNRLTNNTRAFLQEIAEADPSLEAEVAATLVQLEDARNDILKLEAKGSTGMSETLSRATGGRLTRAQAQSGVDTFDLNRGQWNLSLLEHPQGVVRGLLANSAQFMSARTGAKGADVFKRAFMIPAVCNRGESTVLLNPGGRTAQIAWRVMSMDQLAARAAGLATATQSAGGGFRTLGEGPGTREFYVPIPPENLDEVKEIMKERRAEFLEGDGE